MATVAVFNTEGKEVDKIQMIAPRLVIRESSGKCKE